MKKPFLINILFAFFVVLVLNTVFILIFQRNPLIVLISLLIGSGIIVIAYALRKLLLKLEDLSYLLRMIFNVIQWQIIIGLAVVGLLIGKGITVWVFVILSMVVAIVGQMLKGVILKIDPKIGWKFLSKRLLSTLVTMLIIISMIFFMIRLAPGDPFAKEGKNLPEVVRQNLEKKYHLDRPMFIQYLEYLSSIIFEFDFGPSFKYRGFTVNDLIAQKFPVSFSLGAYAILISLLLGVIIGIISALKPNTFIDYFFMSFALIGISTPMFVIAPLLILFLARFLQVVPVGGWGRWEQYIIPVLTLSFPYTAYIARLTKAGMLDNIRKEFVITARAKGLSESTILFRHVLKGSLIPVISFIGPAFAAIVTGSMVVEQICGIPGMGTDYINAALNRDYTLISGVMIAYSGLLVVMNFIVDILYAFLDPRTKYN